ncbi:MAG: polyprenyl synthetase family protein [Proteobacteria bacterium]|nr:polyprenyl synthetase family protein [Pseudomonadota bacterium]MCP4922298.1 polyprenyl synthetase family protein [Pseudomonadota bacterium]
MIQAPPVLHLASDSDASTRAPGLSEVEALMVKLSAGRHLERCGAMAVEHLTGGGKRIRARLALAAHAALTGTTAGSLGWAAACELLHNASLVHDDLQDGDTVRRGSPTLWAKYGAPQAINAGDLLLMLPTLALDHVEADDGTRWRLSRCLAEHAADTVRGQSLEMTLLNSRRVGWNDYLRGVDGKTAGFFGLPVHGAALLAGRNGLEARALAAEFRRIGVVFQLQDDVIDLFGEKGRGAVGADIREGKVSALVVEHLRLYPEDTGWLLSILETPRDETTNTQVAEVCRRFSDGGALDEVLDRIYEFSAATYRSTVLDDEPALRKVACTTLDHVLEGVRHIDPSLPVDDRTGALHV